MSHNIVYVDRFTNGVLNPEEEMAYKVNDGGYIVATTTPGCWGTDDNSCIKKRT